MPDLSNYSEYREPFVGGGSVALWVTKQYPDISVWINDLYEPLYNFWACLQVAGDVMQDRLTEIKKKYPDRDSARELFVESKETITDKKKGSVDKAILFYIACQADRRRYLLPYRVANP